MTDDDDELGAARGILLAVAIGAGIWAGLGYAVWRWW
jgi:hypothetical protein